MRIPRIGDLIIVTDTYRDLHQRRVIFYGIDLKGPIEVIAKTNSNVLCKNDSIPFTAIKKIITKEEYPEYWL